MDEGRKRVLLIAASILAARRLADWDGGPPLPKFVAAVSDSIRIAERILQAIDDRWPDKSKTNSDYRNLVRPRDDRH
jgi:hypothetical protein